MWGGGVTGHGGWKAVCAEGLRMGRAEVMRGMRWFGLGVV